MTSSSHQLSAARRPFVVGVWLEVDTSLSSPPVCMERNWIWPQHISSALDVQKKKINLIPKCVSEKYSMKPLPERHFIYLNEIYRKYIEIERKCYVVLVYIIKYRIQVAGNDVTHHFSRKNRALFFLYGAKCCAKSWTVLVFVLVFVTGLEWTIGLSCSVLHQSGFGNLESVGGLFCCCQSILIKPHSHGPE